MTVDDDCFDFTDLHDLNSGVLVLPGFDEFSESQLCVPTDSLGDLEWFPCFSGDFITSNKSSFCFTSDQFHKHERGEKTEQTNGIVNDDWVGISEVAIGGFTMKKSRTKNRARRSLTVIDRKRCSHCETAETPQWRHGPNGPKTLCNACGMRFRSGRLLPEYRPAVSPTFDECRHSNYHRKIMEKRGLDC